MSLEERTHVIFTSGEECCNFSDLPFKFPLQKSEVLCVNQFWNLLYFKVCLSPS